MESKIKCRICHSEIQCNGPEEWECDCHSSWTQTELLLNELICSVNNLRNEIEHLTWGA